MIKRLLQSASVKNAGWLIFGRIGQMVISFAVGILTARYLGPANYGVINYALAYTAFFMAFCNLGINSVLVKELIDHPDEEGTILGSSMLLQAISSFLSVALITSIVLLVDAGEITTIAVTVLCNFSLVVRVLESLNYWFQSRLQSRVTAIVLLIAYAVTSAYKVILLIFQKGVEWFAFATTLDYLIVGILLLLCYKKHGGATLSWSVFACRRILSKSTHFILPSLMVSIYGYADKFMLKQMLSESDVGYYATATAVCGMWTFVLSAVIDSMYPSIMEAHKKDRQLYEKKNRQLYAIVFYFAIAVSVLFCILGNWIIWFLYGENYLPAVIPLKVVTWYTSFAYLGVARNAWIVCEDKQRYLKYIYVPAAVSNILLNLVCIPIFGATGAAAATLITQILTTLVIPFFIKDLRYNSALMIEGILFKKIR